jgi:Protein of unknown function (DUF3667)
MSHLKPRSKKTYRPRKHLKLHQKEHTCPTCGNGYDGSYCNNCGEKVFHEHDLSLPHLVEQTVDSFTHFDLKIPKSLLNVFNPGFLTYEFLHGIRVPFAKPVQLFIICNVIFFFCHKIVTFSDYTPVLGDHHAFSLSRYLPFKWAEPIDTWVGNSIDQITLDKGKTLKMIPDSTQLDSLYNFLYEQQPKSQGFLSPFNQAFYNKSTVYSKTFMLLLIPLYALVFHAFLFKKIKYFGATLIFALHFACFNLLMFGIYHIIVIYFKIPFTYPLHWLGDFVPKIIRDFLWGDFGFEFWQLCFFVPYFFIAFRRLFALKWYWNLPLSYLLGRIVFFINFGIYKKILTVLTLWLM